MLLELEDDLDRYIPRGSSFVGYPGYKDIEDSPPVDLNIHNLILHEPLEAQLLSEKEDENVDIDKIESEEVKERYLLNK